MGDEGIKFWAGGFLYNPKTHSVLLHKRDSKTKVNPDKWAFFGGLGEGSETPKQTFDRELHEELTIEIPEKEIKPLCDYFNEELQTYRYVFFAGSSLEKMQMRLTEGEEFDWISLDNVFEYDLTEKTKRDLETFLQKGK
ncbi:MAG: NUDIX domain-containing protein [bacterium]|nr:NUDIX domain-containing protein [bacterium]